ncbi:polysaccharide deacetylase family protein [Fluviicola taffensis]|uniref:polysaccharide deacetylase family protein n=1 Tax=Fluviicola taffensis TaxID=191579 RepID=UPI003137F853
MLFYVDEISVRLIYTLDFVFNEHGLAYQLTNDKPIFESFEGTKISYSDFEFGNTPCLNPASLLFEETFRESIVVEKGSWHGVDCLKFDSVSDPLSSIFYVLTRYEEYHVKFPDEHGRFTSKESIQSKLGWLHIQIVEHWIEAFFRIHSPKYLKQLELGRSVQIIPSFDIDNTFAFKWKEGWRSWLSNGKDLVKNNQERLKIRKLVQKGELEDPFDAFELIRSIYKNYPETRVFWHLGNYAKYDTNIAWNDQRHQQLILEMSSIGYLGLHPSYSSNYSDEKLNQEVVRIKTITSKPIGESRQHFLKLNLPKTYRRMMDQGFEKDFTMGYADDYGFRAGTAHEHAFFDLLTNEAFPHYRIVPFAYMDGTLLEYKKLSIEKSLAVIDQLVAEVKRYGGVFCFIWHNETIAEAGKWKGWKKVFDHTLEQLK